MKNRGLNSYLSAYCVRKRRKKKEEWWAGTPALVYHEGMIHLHGFVMLYEAFLRRVIIYGFRFLEPVLFNFLLKVAKGLRIKKLGNGNSQSVTNFLNGCYARIFTLVINN